MTSFNSFRDSAPSEEFEKKKQSKLYENNNFPSSTISYDLIFIISQPSHIFFFSHHKPKCVNHVWQLCMFSQLSKIIKVCYPSPRVSFCLSLLIFFRRLIFISFCFLSKKAEWNYGKLWQGTDLTQDSTRFFDRK